MARNTLFETEHAVTRADQRWHSSVDRGFGQDGVLRDGHLPQARGEPERAMRCAFEAC